MIYYIYNNYRQQMVIFVLQATSSATDFDKVAEQPVQSYFLSLPMSAKVRRKFKNKHLRQREPS